MNIFERGYNRWLTREAPSENLESKNAFEEGVSPNMLLSGGLSGNLEMVDGHIQSSNFVEDTTGWQIKYDGTAQFSDITLIGGQLKYQKTSFTDDTKAGYYIGSEGIYAGAVDDATKLKFTIADGSLEFIGSHSGGTIGGVNVTNIANVGTSTADAVPEDLTVSDTGITVADDGTVSAYVTLTWTAITTDTFDHYLIRYKKNAYTYYTNISTTANTITIDGLVPNTAYNFGIASVNKYGTQSAFSANVNQTTATSTTPPATVADVSATAGIQYVIVEWTANSEKDIASYNVYRHTADSSGDASLVANLKGTYFVDGGRTGGTELFYWVKAVNTSGLESENFSIVDSATPRNVASSDNQISNIGWVQNCVFSSTNETTVTWTSGTFKTSADANYNISGGNTGVMSARTYIYLDIATSETAYQITTTATDAVGDNKVLVAVAENNTGGATFQVFGGAGGMFIDGSDLVASSVTTDQIAANTIVAGNIAAGTITATEIDTDTITSLNNLVVAATNILIDGTTYLSNWRNSSDVTKIDGGQIYTGSITTTQLNFTPVQATNVIASINASEEGITIDADNITISGATNFSAGYDPSDKVDAVGGTYDSAASGARVRIFPDANTGIQIIDDESNDVFKAIVGGTNVGDVIIGNYAGGQGIFYDKSENKTTFAGILSAAAGTLGEVTAGTLTGAVVRTGTTGERIIFNFSDTPVGGSVFTKALVSKDEDNRYSRIIHARGQEDVALFRPLTPRIETDNLYYIKDRRIDSAVASSASAAINIWSQPIHTDGQARNHSGRAITAYSVYPLVFGYATKNTSGTLDISGHWHISNAVQPLDNQAYWNANITGYDFVGYNLGSSPKNYKIEIDGTGSPNTFRWSDDGGSNWNDTEVNVIKGSSGGEVGWFGYLESDDGSRVQIRFNNTTGGVIGDYWEFTTGATTNTSSVGFFGQERRNSESSVLGLTQASKTSTHFQKFIWLGGTYIYRSDGTTPNGNLNGTTGDMCLNCDGGKAYYCTGGTNWTAM